MKRSILAFLALSALFVALPIFADEEPAPEAPAAEEAAPPPAEEPAKE